jgi:hypothetical protein
MSQHLYFPDITLFLYFTFILGSPLKSVKVSPQSHLDVLGCDIMGAVGAYQHFRGASCCHLQGQLVQFYRQVARKIIT